MSGTKSWSSRMLDASNSLPHVLEWGIESCYSRVLYAFDTLSQVVETDVGASGKLLNKGLIALISGSRLSVAQSIPMLASNFEECSLMGSGRSSL